MKKIFALIFILGFTAVAEAREFYKYNIQMQVTHTDIMEGTKILMPTQAAEVRISDDEKYCVVMVAGLVLTCEVKYWYESSYSPEHDDLKVQLHPWLDQNLLIGANLLRKFKAVGYVGKWNALVNPGTSDDDYLVESDRNSTSLQFSGGPDSAFHYVFGKMAVKEKL